jgi:hypothetical protein
MDVLAIGPFMVVKQGSERDEAAIASAIESKTSN